MQKVRKRFTATERRRIVNEYQTSGLTQREFATRVGISVACLSIWLRRAKEEQRGGNRVAWLELPPAARAVRQEPGCGGGSFSYRVQLPGGAVLEIPPGFARTEVLELLELLKRV
ncbi:MAG TPA: transposase [Prosthecobacter sp.]|nr:transposase [Prosthecobacter sp.]